MPHTKHMVYSSVRFKPHVPPRVNGYKPPTKPSKCGNPQISIVNVPEPPPRPGYTMGNYNEKMILFEKSNPHFTGSPSYNEPKLPIRKCDRKKDQTTTICGTKENVDTVKETLNEPMEPDINGRCNKACQIRRSGKSMRHMGHVLAVLLLFNSAVLILHYKSRVKSPHQCSTDKEDLQMMIVPKHVHEDNRTRRLKMMPTTASSSTATTTVANIEAATRAMITTTAEKPEYRNGKCVYRELYSHKEGLSTMCQVIVTYNTASLDQCLHYACRKRQANAINFLGSMFRCNIKRCDLPLTDRRNLELTDRYGGSDVLIIVK